jgi:hypothetical protein
MKNIFYFLITFSLLLFSCNNDDDKTSKEEENQKIAKMYDDIISFSMAKNTSCTNPEEWSFTAIGSKGCGGPTGYIPYSLKINTSEFLIKVENYNTKQVEYNKKWNIVSDCMVVSPPFGVVCIDGKPTLTYSIVK